jgi:hypothetical protein
MQLFSEAPIQEFQNAHNQVLLNRINNYDSFALSLEKEAEGFAEDFYIQPIKIDTSKWASRFVNESGSDFKDSIFQSQPVFIEYTITVSIPKEELLKYRPNHYVSPSVKISFKKDKELQINFTIAAHCEQTNLPDNIADEVVKIRDEVFKNIQANLKQVNSYILTYNQGVYSFALNHFKEKQRLRLSKGLFATSKFKGTGRN